MRHILSDVELRIISDWENKLPYKFDVKQVNDNVDIVIGTAWSKFGKITPESLDAAVALSFRSLKYMIGHEHPVLKAELVKAAADTAQQQKDADELERKRKRDDQIKAGIKPNQARIRTEFDRDEGSQKRAQGAREAAEKAAFKQVEDASREEVERLRNGYMVSHNGGQTNWARTSERRELLKATRGSKRDGTGLWAETLRLIKDCLRAFQPEDFKRQR